MTKHHKYIYWYYEDEKEGLIATEELFDLRKDPYELTNAAKNPEYKSVLENMRKIYDQQMEHWKTDGVKYNGYEEYGTLFDRNISWEAKAPLIKKKGKKK